MSKETIHKAFETDLNDAKTAEDAFKMLGIYYSTLCELVQPEAQNKDRMKKIRLMTPKVGHAIMVYHAFVCGKVAFMNEQIKKREQNKSLWQRIFRR